MKLYFAPMEGITLAAFRRVYQEFFPGIDKFFSPFLVANQTLHFTNKEIRDILPENNEGIPLVPQILTNKAHEMLWAVEELRTCGYREINLNLGCSMPQVAKRGRGAGFLEDKERLNRFFEEVFAGLAGKDVKLSVKTRIGTTSSREAMELMEIYNRYPISELIIHPRRMCDLYRSVPDLDTFEAMAVSSLIPVCYNGDIYTPEDLDRIRERFPKLERIMVGRGFLRDPSLSRQLLGKGAATGEELFCYHNALFQSWLQTMQEERQAVAKMKGVWMYWQNAFPGKEREFKKLRKAIYTDRYMESVRGIMDH